jgi:hypothetical protein
MMKMKIGFVNVIDNTQKLRSTTFSAFCIQFSLQRTTFTVMYAFFLDTLNLTEELLSALPGSTTQTHKPVLCYWLCPLEDVGRS